MTKRQSIDFQTLTAPRDSGQVLIAPPASELAELARENHELLSSSEPRLEARTDARTSNQTIANEEASAGTSCATERLICGKPLAHWRTETRAKILRNPDALAIVTGHQPEFIHAGVWAKHVVAARLAQATGGEAINLVVDNDAPKRTSLTIPIETESGTELQNVPTTTARAGFAYEQSPPMARKQIDQLDKAVRDALADRYEHSMMPTYLRALHDQTGAKDWVDQHIAARAAVDRELGVKLTDVRVSEVWCSALLVDMLTQANEFAGAYNAALENYRAENSVRSPDRPIPDLAIEHDRIEVALWTYREGEPRRRVFVRGRGQDELELFAGEQLMGRIPQTDLDCCDARDGAIRSLEEWKLRPRALTLTLWARLLLADLFIHGIGGAKYDRITDSIIETYYGRPAPGMACASATLRLYEDDTQDPDSEIRKIKHELRDLRWNPQRHIKGPDHSAVAPLIAERKRAVDKAADLAQNAPSDAAARRSTFERIRSITTELGERTESKRTALERSLENAKRARRDHAIRTSRDYFFALAPKTALERLTREIPDVERFRV